MLIFSFLYLNLVSQKNNILLGNGARYPFPNNFPFSAPQALSYASQIG